MIPRTFNAPYTTLLNTAVSFAQMKFHSFQKSRTMIYNLIKSPVSHLYLFKGHYTIWKFIIRASKTMTSTRSNILRWAFFVYFSGLTKHHLFIRGLNSGTVMFVFFFLIGTKG